MTDYEALDHLIKKETGPLEKRIKELTQERDEALDKAERYHVASLGMFDPVKVGQVVAQLQMERDEARKIATHLMEHSVDCWAYKAELMEAYPWMREPTAAPTAPAGGQEEGG